MFAEFAFWGDVRARDSGLAIAAAGDMDMRIRIFTILHLYFLFYTMHVYVERMHIALDG